GWIDGRKFERDNPQIVDIGKCLFPYGVGSNASQATAKESIEVLLPLDDEVRRHNNQDTAQQAEPLHLTDVKSSHDRLSGPRLVRQKESKKRLCQHGPVDRVRLMRVWLKG